MHSRESLLTRFGPKNYRFADFLRLGHEPPKDSPGRSLRGPAFMRATDERINRSRAYNEAAADILRRFSRPASWG